MEASRTQVCHASLPTTTEKTCRFVCSHQQEVPLVPNTKRQVGLSVTLSSAPELSVQSRCKPKVIKMAQDKPSRKCRYSFQ